MTLSRVTTNPWPSLHGPTSLWSVVFCVISVPQAMWLAYAVSLSAVPTNSMPNAETSPTVRRN